MATPGREGRHVGGRAVRPVPGDGRRQGTRAVRSGRGIDRVRARPAEGRSVGRAARGDREAQGGREGAPGSAGGPMKRLLAILCALALAGAAVLVLRAKEVRGRGGEEAPAPEEPVVTATIRGTVTKPDGPIWVLPVRAIVGEETIAE